MIDKHHIMGTVTLASIITVEWFPMHKSIIIAFMSVKYLLLIPPLLCGYHILSNLHDYRTASSIKQFNFSYLYWIVASLYGHKDAL